MKHKKGVHCDRKVEQKVSLVIDVNEIQKLKKKSKNHHHRTSSSTTTVIVTLLWV